MNEFVCLDIETTGLSYKDNEIIEIGLVKIADGQIVEKYSTLIKPQKPLVEFITKLTGITDDLLINAPVFSEVYPKIKNFIGQNILVAHNIKFDFDMLNQEFLRLGSPSLTNKLLDTQELALILYPHFYSHKLSALAKNFNILLKAHRALNDALAVAEIFLKMHEELLKINPLILNQALKILPLEKQALKEFLAIFYQEIYQGKSLNYLDYLNGLKDISQPKKDTNFKSWPKDIKSFFQEESPLNNNFTNFEIRDSQANMAEFIFERFQNAEYGVVEAGTGIGKTLAYLIPSIIWSKKQGKPIIISTKTKHLQNQIMFQDLLRTSCENIPNFTFALVKGKENFLDLRKFDSLLKEFNLGLHKNDAIEFLGLFNWLLTTKLGDLTELHPTIYKIFYYKINFTTFSEYNDNRVFKNKCFVQKMRRKAKQADLIITNHSLVFADYFNGNKILPAYDYIIFDEAHSLEDIVGFSTGKVFSNFTLKELFSNFSLRHKSVFLEQIDLVNKRLVTEKNCDFSEYFRYLKDKINELKEQHNVFFDYLKTLFRDTKILSGEKKQIIFSAKLGNGNNFAEIKYRLNDLILELKTIRKIFEQIIEELNKFNKDNVIKNMCHIFIDNEDFLKQLILDLEVQIALPENFITWLEEENTNKAKFLKLISVPINIKNIFQDYINQKKSCIFTSATLSINQQFDYFLNRLGITENFKTLILASEFDYYNQAEFNLFTDLPVFQDTEEYYADIAQSIFQIVTSNFQKTLVLFTAQKSLRRTYHYLKELLNNYPTTVFCQNIHGSRESILERFKQFDQAVIFGLDSFWEGVDLAGDLLKCLIIQKMPFPVPSDPLHQARMDLLTTEGKDSFMNYSLPLAVLKFKQGIGRLIRTKQDTGSIYVLDTRLVTKYYGKYFLKEVENYRNNYVTKEMS